MILYILKNRQAITKEVIPKYALSYYLAIFLLIYIIQSLFIPFDRNKGYSNSYKLLAQCIEFFYLYYNLDNKLNYSFVSTFS